MKSITQYISLSNEKISSIDDHIIEKLIIGKDRRKSIHKYFPKTKKELQDILKELIKEQGNEADLNIIDTSKITDMSYIFGYHNSFNGDISTWDVSNVKTFNGMFWKCKKFNSDISNWDVSNAISMKNMFTDATLFNQDLSQWNVSNVNNMYGMFWNAESFDEDISNWNVSNVNKIDWIFQNCPIKDKHKPKFKKNLYNKK